MEVGHALTVWNRSAEKTRPLADKRRRASRPRPPSCAKRAEAIITILTDAAAIDAVYDGPRACSRATWTGKLFIEMSTVPPETQMALAEKVRAKGAAFVECPVGGSTVPGAAGQAARPDGRRAAPTPRAPSRSSTSSAAARHGGPVGSGEVHEVHRQHAADGLLAGARRGARRCAARSGLDPAESWSFFRHLGRRRTCSRSAAPIAAAMQRRRRRPDDLRPRQRHQGHPFHAGGGQARAASSCRSCSRRSPATRKRATAAAGGPRGQRHGLLGQTRRALIRSSTEAAIWSRHARPYPCASFHHC